MSIRTIKTVSPQNANPIKNIETSATTFGELKADLQSAGVQYEGMAITVKSNKSSLVLDDAILPEGDQVLYITPTKVKSGYFEPGDFDNDYSEEQIIKLGQAIQAHVTRLEAMIEGLVRGVQVQAAATQSTPTVGLRTPVVVEEIVETPRISAEDQALLDEASSLFSTRSSSTYEDDEEADYDDED